MKPLLVGLTLAGCVASAQAADDLRQCAQISEANKRLQCYDDLATRQDSPAQAPAPRTLPVAATLSRAAAPDTESVPQPEPRPDWSARSYLTKAWNLDGRGREGRAHLTPLRPYRTSYLIARSSSSPNRAPTTPTTGHTTLTPMDLDTLETKFQFSFKGEVLSYRQIDWLGFDSFRLWGAYTQQSNWQAFNTRNSSPFRETNYEPEVIATFGTKSDGPLQLVNLGFSHQSNGRSLPESRSWNRLYLQGGWEWEHDWSVLARAWYRIPENAQKNDNPDIESYLGIADAQLRWEAPDDSQSVLVLLRNNLRTSQNRGFMQIDWTTPVYLGKSAKLHAQFTSGYGESLIDYNHRQTTFGLGVSFREW